MQEIKIHHIEKIENWCDMGTTRYEVIYQTPLGKIRNEVEISNELMNEPWFNLEAHIMNLAEDSIQAMIKETK